MISSSLSALLKKSTLMPAIFVGHGSPMNAVEQNTFTDTLIELGTKLRKPKAVLVISAHWQTKGTYVASASNPETIYDFRGFPPELYEIIYPAKGSPALATYLSKILMKVPVLLDNQMGMDHGAWTILKYIFPKADVPVLQLSLNHQFTTQQHYELGVALASLRSQDVLILGSGNIVHNLRRIDFNRDAIPFDWVSEFDLVVKNLLMERNHIALTRVERLGNYAMLAVPTTEHYLPMLYTIATQKDKESVYFFYEGFQNASVSMRSFIIT